MPAAVHMEDKLATSLTATSASHAIPHARGTATSGACGGRNGSAHEFVRRCAFLWVFTGAPCYRIRGTHGDRTGMQCGDSRRAHGRILPHRSVLGVLPRLRSLRLHRPVGVGRFRRHVA